MICFSILLVNKFENNNYDKLKSIEKYDKSQIGNITFKFLIGLFCNGFLYSILEFQTIHLFNPNHIFVCYELSKIADFFYILKTCQICLVLFHMFFK